MNVYKLHCSFVSLKKIFFFLLFFTFISCQKCNYNYINPNSKSTFLRLDVELSHEDIEGLEDILTVYINFKDLKFKNKYLDSIKVIPIYKKQDTLQFINMNEPIYMFKADKNKVMDKLDVKVILYANDFFVNKDTCLVFENLKMIKNCYYSNAFH